ncbi:MAG: hypothetical protein HT580_09475 [Dechloromonas sp.]|nr:MAG: hypothetical protein HT580_09475 [Dechloromonas sp.]
MEQVLVGKLRPVAVDQKFLAHFEITLPRQSLSHRSSQELLEPLYKSINVRQELYETNAAS